MRYLKVRLLGLVTIAIGAGLGYYNWRELWQQRRYSTRIAAFAPVLVVGGLFIFLFPARGGKPATGKEKLIALLVFGLGLALGLLNWYLMDPGFFQW